MSQHARVALAGILTQDEGMEALLRSVQKVARRDTTVLVRGETGAGKELIARAIHEASSRAGGPFLAINCAALPENLLESQLFGHVRGAFTGALRDHQGHFRSAQGGTLFLDEVAELPLSMQAKLLRVLEEGSVFPVGATHPIPIDARIVAATNRSLRQEVLAGRFREDLMYRIRVVPLFLPSLRERPKDIPLLAKHFVRTQAQSTDARKSISVEAMDLLQDYAWPGNVRELQNVIEYALAMGEGDVIKAVDLPPEVRGIVPTFLQPQDSAYRELKLALEKHDWHRQKTAEDLGISRATLWRRMREAGLSSPT